MARIALIVSALTFLAAVVLGFAEGKHWPDFSCHPHNKTTLQQRTVRHHKMGWDSCKEHYEVNKGSCDKICILWNREILVRYADSDPFKFDIDEFMVIFRDELGIDEEEPGTLEKELMNNVNISIEGCTKKYPEYATVPPQKTPCEPYKQLFLCIDKAVMRGFGNPDFSADLLV